MTEKPSKKKQHYIHRFYLKYFSRNSSGTHISLYNIHSKRHIQLADLRHQCYENYFYGKGDESIEEELSVIEGFASQALNDIASNLMLPSNMEHLQHLRLFTFIQSARTFRSAKETNDFVNFQANAIMKRDNRVKDIANKVRIQSDNAAILNIRTFLKSIPIVQDLRCKLLVNETRIPFVTSDQPVIRYNQFAEQKGFLGGSLGVACQGLQIFFPIGAKSGQTDPLFSAEVDPKIANEVSQIIALLEIKQDTTAVFKLAKVIENLLVELYEKDPGLMELTKSNGRKSPVFADYLEFAKIKGIVSKEDYHLISILKIIRNEEAHDLAIEKEKSRIVAAFLSGIALILSLCKLLRKQTAPIPD